MLRRILGGESRTCTPDRQADGPGTNHHSKPPIIQEQGGGKDQALQSGMVHLPTQALHKNFVTYMNDEAAHS